MVGNTEGEGVGLREKVRLGLGLEVGTVSGTLGIGGNTGETDGAGGSGGRSVTGVGVGRGVGN